MGVSSSEFPPRDGPSLLSLREGSGGAAAPPALGGRIQSTTQPGEVQARPPPALGGRSAQRQLDGGTGQLGRQLAASWQLWTFRNEARLNRLLNEVVPHAALTPTPLQHPWKMPRGEEALWEAGNLLHVPCPLSLAPTAETTALPRLLGAHCPGPGSAGKPFEAAEGPCAIAVPSGPPQNAHVLPTEEARCREPQLCTAPLLRGGWR